MLCQLLAGEYASAGELARAASATPATASGHMGKLMATELLVYEHRGRHRYYKLADDEVAHALEATALIAFAAPTLPFGTTTPRASGYALPAVGLGAPL